MCGIAGFFFSNDRPNARMVVADMLEGMRYRGPDHRGLHESTLGCMGSVRLAIRGVDAAGHQPLFNEDRTIAVIFNGEIYNSPELHDDLVARGHVLASRSDTEVLVHLYEEHGADFVRLLNGMFALAIVDLSNQLVLLARDRIGQKPLFVRSDRDGLVFCSELGPLIQSCGSAGISPSAVQQFLALGYILEPETICRDVRAVLPGTLEVHRADQPMQRQRYWSFETVSPTTPLGIEDWLDHSEPIFRRAVRRHLLSDMPVTLFLSGGVDSSLVLTLAALEGGVTEAFCGAFSDAPDHDESAYAEALSSSLGVQCHHVSLGEETLAGCLPDLLAGMSQPIGDYSALAVFPLAAEAAKRYSVVLGGDGGDELFGGYPTYRLPSLQRTYGLVPRCAVRLGHRLTAAIASRDGYMNAAFQLQQVAQAWGHDAATAHFEIKNFLPPSALDVLQPEYRAGARGTAAHFRRLFAEQTTPDVPVRLATMDLVTFLQSGTIPKVDRMTMLHSLEARMPLLDNEIIDVARRTPSALRMHGGALKAPLRGLLARLWKSVGIANAPRLNPRKQGFSPPLRKLLRGRLKAWRDDSLAMSGSVFTPDVTDHIRSLNRAGLDTHRLEWNICMLKNWLAAWKLGT